MKKEKVFKLLLAAYVLVLAWIILLKCSFNISLNILPYRWSNYIPFQDFIMSLQHGFEYGDWYSAKSNAMDLIINAILFVPFGFLAASVTRGKNKLKCIMAAFFLSAIFEGIQFATKLGICDITDVITNTAGAALGVIIYAGVKRLRKNHEQLL